MALIRRIALISAIFASAAAAGGGAAALASGSGAAAGTAAASVPNADWPTFDFNVQRTGVGPTDTGITPATCTASGASPCNFPARSTHRPSSSPMSWSGAPSTTSRS